MTQESPRSSIDPRHASGVADGESSHAPEVVQTLKQAMRRARFDDAERVGVQSDIRATQIARLELLQEALKPLLSQIPADVDLFDIGIMPGTTPRLFIDMIGFVEMGRDARLYRFLQDTRHRRVTIAEASDVAAMVQAITDYVARRLLERDKALASDAIDGGEGKAAVTTTDAAATRPAAAVMANPPQPDALPAGKKRRLLRLLALAFAFVIDLLGAIAFFTILAVAGWLLWNRMHGQV